MQRLFHHSGIWILLLWCVAGVSVTDAQKHEGPLGLQWGMTTEAVEQLDIGLCCRQVGKYGARYEVDPADFANFPNGLGDEEKVYLYFGNTNKLLRIFIAIRKVDGWNRYNQINTILGKQYTLKASCKVRKYTKYESLEKGKVEKTCKNYQAYSEYQDNNIEVFVGLERESTVYRITIVQLHRALYEFDKKEKSPL